MLNSEIEQPYGVVQEVLQQRSLQWWMGGHLAALPWTGRVQLPGCTGSMSIPAKTDHAPCALCRSFTSSAPKHVQAPALCSLLQ